MKSARGVPSDTVPGNLSGVGVGVEPPSGDVIRGEICEDEQRSEPGSQRRAHEIS